jgi:DNA sulfur modification protein DndD
MLAIEHQLASYQAKLNDVKERLIGVEEDEPRKLEISIQDFSEQLGMLKGREEAEKTNLDLAREVKGELDQRISGINQAELTVLAKRIETIKAAAEVFDGAVSAYRDERRADVESAATGIFTQIRTKESFARLEINSQFGLNIVTEDGIVLDRAEWRSSGEEQIVALALIGALNRCAKVKAPVFMDTPFGRLDTKHGKRVLTYLPSLADQVVLLVTDREFHKGDERFLEGKIKSDFTVIYRGEREGAAVNPTTT